jgi:hypothetical protein
MTCGYPFLGSLALVLTGCAVPYYPLPPAPVSYAVQPASAYYPLRRASIPDQAPPAAASRDSPQTRVSLVKREHHATGEQKEARQGDRERGAGKTSGWINPQPLSGS